MASVPGHVPPSFTLVHRGHRLGLSARREGKRTLVELSFGGRQVGVRDVRWGRARFTLEECELGIDLPSAGLAGAVVDARVLRPGRLSGCALLIPTAPSTDPAAVNRPRGPRPERVTFEPPAGTRARRLWEFERDHPAAYAARHVIVGAGKVIVPLLGLGALLSLLPSFSIPFPDVSLPNPPDIPWPDWDLPDWSLPGWLRAILGTSKYWLPVLIAVGFAFSEYERRKKRDAANRDADGTAENKPD